MKGKVETAKGEPGEEYPQITQTTQIPEVNHGWTQMDTDVRASTSA